MEKFIMVNDDSWHSELYNTLKMPISRLNYISYLNLKNNSLYIETPKVACTAIKKLLICEQDESLVSIEPTQIHSLAQQRIARIRSLNKEIVFNAFFGDTFRYAFVRNPFTRILSAYLDKIVKNQWERQRLLPGLGVDPSENISFSVFLDKISLTESHKQDIHFTSQCNLLMPNKIKYSYIGRFETLGNDIEYLVSKNIFSKSFLNEMSAGKHHQTNADERLKEYVTPEVERKILKIFARDFEEFNYS